MELVATFEGIAAPRLEFIQFVCEDEFTQKSPEEGLWMWKEPRVVRLTGSLRLQIVLPTGSWGPGLPKVLPEAHYKV